MKNPLKRLTHPLILRVNFEEAYWEANKLEAGTWILIAIASDLLVQWLFGRQLLVSMVTAVVTAIILWFRPPRLAAAIAGMYTTQALISVLVVKAAGFVGGWYVAELAGTVWMGWCMFAILKLILTYIRTPKHKMCTV
ncbi:hypothetical protein KTD31_03600 [Burkholderia multivorans]|uniref:hypothetical protein n=1 Tax=Burkholderia multivorans TaxID=87883 RepID=UPI001C23827B|nr:hypothetical protein [Burkholderia multivorans]MBU9200439.1 hypothetical protein [Burkholderia multivorans]MDN8078436.1 hypothetical protein [Burkholderia multivorans]